MSNQKCTIPNCPNFAQGDTTPPLCPIHLDLDVLVDFIIARGEQPTLENVQKYYYIGRSNSDFWTLTCEQIPEHLPAVLTARQVTCTQ